MKGSWKYSRLTLAARITVCSNVTLLHQQSKLRVPGVCLSWTGGRCCDLTNRVGSKEQPEEKKVYDNHVSRAMTRQQHGLVLDVRVNAESRVRERTAFVVDGADLGNSSGACKRLGANRLHSRRYE